MMESVPRVLYKYRAPARIDILINGEIRFTPAAALNDIYEMKPIPVFSEHQYLAAQEMVFRMNPHLVGQRLEPPSDAAHMSALDEALECVFCLCLAERWDNALMWSYYTDSHKGFVVGFDPTNCELFRPPFKRIKYSPERPTIGYGDADAWDRAIFTKADYWNHEEEWRAIRFTDTSPGFMAASLPPQAILEVVIGNRADPQLEIDLASCLSEERYKHVRMYRAIPHRSTWSLEREEILISGHRKL